MTLSISLSREAEARLRERAAASGEPVDVYATRVLEAAVTAPTLDELLAPVRKQVEDSAMSDAQLDGLLEEVRDEVWQQRRRERP